MWWQTDSQSGRKPLRGVVWLLLAGLVLLPVATPGQTTTATLKGTVLDEEGAPVPEAFVQARSETTGALRTTVTDAEGHYTIHSLPPGNWLLVAHRAGGPMSQARTVTLNLQETEILNLLLGGSVTEEITVEATAPLVDSRRTGEEFRIGGEDIDVLPVESRSVTDLALLDSSVLAPQAGGFYGERDAVFVVNGQSGRSNSYLVDGLDNNDLTSGTTLNSFFSQQVIREYVVMTNQFLPEFGRASGGVLNVVTKRGNNAHQFELFLQGANENLNQPGEFVSSLPEQDGQSDVGTSYQAGFSYGGPFSKDKSFFFFAYEHLDNDRVVPFVGIDASGNAGGWMIAPDSADNFFFRTDFNLSSSNFLMVRLSGDDRTTNGLNVGGIITPEAGFRIEEQDLQLAATWTSVLSPGVISETRLLGGTSVFDQFANSSNPGVSRPGGVFGGNQLNTQFRDEDRIQLVQNMTWQDNTHTWKFGADATFSKTRINTTFNPTGNFLYESDLAFEPGDCTPLVANCDLLVSDVRNALFDAQAEDPDATYDDIKFTPIDLPRDTPDEDDDDDDIIDEGALLGTYPFVYMLVDGQPSAAMDDNIYGLFFQDSWQATPRFHLDYGLRYDLRTYVLPESASVDSAIPNGGAPRDENNIAPRLGFSYAALDSGKLIFRGGAGVFYDKLVLGFPAVASITSGMEIGMTFPQGFTFEFTDEILMDALDQGYTMDEIRQGLNFQPELTLKFSTGTELQTPYAVQYHLGADWGVGEKGVFRVNASHVLGYHQALLRDLNPVDEINLGVPVHRDKYTGICNSGDPAMPDCTGSIAAFVTEGRSWYTGLDLGWNWSGSRGRYSASYTIATAEDMGFDPLKGGIALPPDSDNIAGERGRTDADRRHRFVLYGETDLPWLDLRVSGVMQLASGAAFNVTTGVDDNMDGVLSDRPAGIGRNTGDETDLTIVNALREEYNEERGLELAPIGSLNDPSFAQFDVRVWKVMPFSNGSGHGEVFVQIFNVFDRFNVGLIEGRVISPYFGRPIAMAGPSRTFQLGFKLAF